MMVILIAIPVVVTVLVWPLPQPPEPAVQSRFLGFTNDQWGTGVMFSLRNYPLKDRNFPICREIAFMTDGRWKKAEGVTPGVVGMGYNQQDGYVMLLYVSNTNQPMRAIMEFPAAGKAGMREWVRGTFRRLVGRNPQTQPATSGWVRERTCFSRTKHWRGTDCRHRDAIGRISFSESGHGTSAL